MSSPSVPPTATEILPGIWRFTFGTPEAITPQRTRRQAPAAAALDRLPRVAACPVAVAGAPSARGMLLTVPLAPDEHVYGLGLQLHSFEHRGGKKQLRVNADPALDTGDSHAPVPFYVTSRGYGVFVDTARYATFYLGNQVRAPREPRPGAETPAGHDGWNGVPPYRQKAIGEASEVVVEVPRAAGVDVYVFAGPGLRDAVQRYNLFAGGGPLPPRWGLGFWYRAETDLAADEVLALADELRTRRIPCDVLGLEPHWQAHAYSSSYTWSARFPDPAGTVAALARRHFRVNLWEQAFVHPSSPLYRPLLPHSGDHEVWGGLVPDFLSPEATRLFAVHHDAMFAALGIAGFKADECDNSDFTGNWSFPEFARFPSGADGEQMHSLFGLRYQDALQQVFEPRGFRTYGLVRCSGALAAPYPYVLYSDLYDHGQFVRAVAQSAFSGLLWTPEVRDAASPAELIRRLQAVAFSPVAMVNAWYLKHPPWRQVDRAANAAGRFDPAWEQTEAACRAVIELRMRFIPYLHAAFVRYHRDGLPPFRPLIMDYPDDPQATALADTYLMGEALLVAPVIVSGQAEPPGGVERTVYLPAGEWFDFWSGERLAGPRFVTRTVPLERIPLFVKSGAILPLARPTLHTADPASWELTAHVYGDGRLGASVYEDDGSLSPALPEVRLAWDPVAATGRVLRATDLPGAPRYAVVEWTAAARGAGD